MTSNSAKWFLVGIISVLAIALILTAALPDETPAPSFITSRLDQIDDLAPANP